MSHFGLAIPDVLLPESSSKDHNAEGRGPINKASSKAQLLASKPVQQKITELMDAAYAYADDMSEVNWQAIDDALDTFVDAAQAEADHGNILGLPAAKNRRRWYQFGG